MSSKTPTVDPNPPGSSLEKRERWVLIRADFVTCPFAVSSEQRGQFDRPGTTSTDTGLLREPSSFEDNMKAISLCSVLLVVSISALGATPQKPRVFITESGAPQASGEGEVGDAKGALAFTGGTSPQNVEAMKAFARYCPAVVVTANREKANYLVRLDHEPINPTTPFVHGNKVAVFDKNEDLMYSNSTRILTSAVKGACAAIAADLHP